MSRRVRSNSTLPSSDHNSDNQKGNAGKPEDSPYPAGNIHVLGFYNFGRKSTQTLQGVSEHPQKPLANRRDSSRINCHQQAYVEKRAGQKEYGG
jgi:hypothetical protein